jgi:outer membrane scaffolding protein for murein synthesis (MipA/OmpV family)
MLFFILFLPKTAMCEEKPLWEFGIGVGVIQMPDYKGSNESRIYHLPYPYLVYRGGILQVDDQRITGQFFKTDRILLEFSGYGTAPVDSSKNSARAGMPDLDPTFELGPALKIVLLNPMDRTHKLTLTMPVRAFLSTDFSSVRLEGWVFHPRMEYEKKDFIPRTGLELGVSVGPMFADRSYNDYFYTVKPAYATETRHAYSAGGGYSGITATLGLKKAYRQFVFNAFISADFLDGTVFQNSPLVKTKTSIMSGLGVSWIFLESDKKVNTAK